jgi:hypothetical protein
VAHHDGSTCQVDIEPHVMLGDMYTMETMTKVESEVNLSRRSLQVQHKLSVVGTGEGSLTIMCICDSKVIRDHWICRSDPSEYVRSERVFQSGLSA